ncbi:LytR/AlgR family response regulator transcription factor [Winogradskyella sp. A3E31]|uniref:LytR/AlgR family response regulator transcription factor n=1 Tax=Winogradskyella sp. A3E31 TaxID=3349637 RepID=UPI00398B0511
MFKNKIIKGLPASGFFSGDGRRFIVFSILFVFIALFELGQDYISAVINKTSIVFIESLAYKLFWPLFIPFALMLDYCIKKANTYFKGIIYTISIVFLVIIITITHLIAFSCILAIISRVVHENPVTLMNLITEKLSTRLYIAFSIYLALVVLFLFYWRRKSQDGIHSKTPIKTITIKNRKDYSVVDVTDIKWITSDGAYLDIHTNNKKYVLKDSLKSIITKLPKNFKRIHRSTIVNSDRIKKLKSRGNGDYDIILDDNQELRLSRNYTKGLKGNLL